MNSILLIFPFANKEVSKEAAERIEFLKNLDTSELRNAAVEKILEGCFLIRAKGGLPFFCSAVAQSHSRRVHYKVLFFESHPEWLDSKPVA